jgi:4-diphosphocytidyl-2-C-methyl-D-erythritol kinase
MQSIRVSAPAKINLFLRVLSKRPDGYHNIETLFQAIDVFDELIFQKASDMTILKVAGLPEFETEDNLIMRALMWFERYFETELHVEINLKKNIPLAAGLGGGSSDAAAAMLAIRELFQLPLSDKELQGAAVSLGADVPFFFSGGSAIGEGIGDVITPVDIPQDYDLIIVNPGFPVSTAKVYSEFSRTLTAHPMEGRLGRVLQEVRGISGILHNDLQAVTERLYPEVSEIRNVLIEHGLSGVLMSGSGPTVFGITETGRAEDIGRRIPSKWTVISSRPTKVGIAFS